MGRGNREVVGWEGGRGKVVGCKGEDGGCRMGRGKREVVGWEEGRARL